jgi:hypothetical protein
MAGDHAGTTASPGAGGAASTGSSTSSTGGAQPSSSTDPASSEGGTSSAGGVASSAGGVTSSAGGSTSSGAPSCTRSAGSAASGRQATGTPGVWTRQTIPITPLVDCGGACGGVQSVRVDPVRPSDFYAFAASSPVTAVLASTDYGTTWTSVKTTSEMNGNPWGAAIDPNPCRDPASPPTLYSPAGYGSTGLWKSLDRGVTWTQLFAGDNVFSPYTPFGTIPDVYAVHILPDDPPNHLLLTFHGNWVDPSNGKKDTSIDAGFGESTDGGKTWAVHRSPEGAGSSHYMIVVDSNTWLSISQDTGIWRTTSAGRVNGAISPAAWTKVDGLVHEHGSYQPYVDPANGDIYSPGLNGIKRSTDHGATWSSVYSNGGYMSGVIGTKNFLYASDLYAVALVRSDASGNMFSTYTTKPGDMKYGSAPYGNAASFDGAHWVIVTGNIDGLFRYIEP